MKWDFANEAQRLAAMPWKEALKYRDMARQGPEWGKKNQGVPDSFMKLVERIGVKWDASVEAQRICLNAKRKADGLIWTSVRAYRSSFDGLIAQQPR
jgi:hypothetical protein